jgi:4-amino-4-deoxy-L-arabinose transferase-like glycosyltransferase
MQADLPAGSGAMTGSATRKLCLPGGIKGRNIKQNAFSPGRPALWSESFTNNRNVSLLILFLLAMTVKIAIAYFATDPIHFQKYPYFAQRVAQGVDIGERILDLSPFYLYATVLFFKIFGPSWDVLALLQAFLGSLTCLIVCLVGARLFGPVTGIIAAVLLLLYGNVTLIELTLEPEAFVLFFNALAVWALLWAGDRHPDHPWLWRWLMAGILIGLSAITKANGLLILPGSMVWIWLSVRTRRDRLGAAAALLMGVALLIGPITLRNYIRFQDYVPITADGGKVFFHGNGPGATGLERADLPDQGFREEQQTEPDYAHALFRETARAEGMVPLKPSGCSTYWYYRTLEHMYTEPMAALLLMGKKFCFFWNTYEAHDLDTTYKNSLAIQGWPLLTMGTVSALGLLGMGLALGSWRRTFPLYWMVLIAFLSVLIFFAASRYRLPAVPFLSIFAALSLVKWFHLIRGKKIVKAALGLILLAGLLAVTTFPFREEIRRFDRWQRASRIHYSMGGRVLFQRGEYREAIGELEKVVSVYPNFAPAYNIIGKSYAVLGDLEDAKRSFEMVIKLTPTLDEGYLNMGLLLLLEGNTSRASAFLKMACELNPGNMKTRFHLEKIEDGPLFYLDNRQVIR